MTSIAPVHNSEFGGLTTCCASSPQVSFLHLAEDEREVGIPETMHYDAPVRWPAHITASSQTCAKQLTHCCAECIGSDRQAEDA